MSKLVRFLSRRRTGKGIKRGVQQSSNADKKHNKHIVVCRVVLLDGTDVTIELPKGSLGDILYQRVFYHLDLLETSYFGLQYTDSGNVNHWLDPTKKIKKQVAIGPPYTLRLRVKFFPTEPSALKEELTRYQFFQQCKADILSGVLPCTDEAMAVELAAYALQSELGDYDEEEHSAAFISEFRFMPNQTEDMELEIFNKYKSMKNQGMTPDKAELQYLHKVKWLDLYGVDMHYVLGRDGLQYKLGLTPTGVLVFEGEEKIGLFYWPKITKFNFKRKKLILVVVEENEGEEHAVDMKQEHTFVFRTENLKACKHLWKCAMEHHTFFRVVVQTHQERSRQGFIRLGSRFRYSGRTQFEQLNRSQARRSVRFERQPSRRFSRRQSLEARERVRRRKPPTSLQPNSNGATASATPEPQAPVVSLQSSPTAVSSPSGANIVSNGSMDMSSPMDRLDNLISANGNERQRTPSARESSSPGLASPTILEHSEAAQAKIKGLSDPPEPMPRPTKDVNLYQNNQVKLIGTKEKVPIEIKSNILKARADEERHNVKDTNTLPRNTQFPPLNVASRPSRPQSIQSAPSAGTTAQHGFSLAQDYRSPTGRGAVAFSPVGVPPNNRYAGTSVMQEDDDVSTESEDESGDSNHAVFSDDVELLPRKRKQLNSPLSPINSQPKEQMGTNGSRLPRNSSTSSSKSITSPVSNKGYINMSRERGTPSPDTSLTRASQPTMLVMSASNDRLATVNGGTLPKQSSVAPSSSDVQPELSLEDHVSSNPFFSNPEAPDGTRSSKRSISSTGRQDLKTNGEVNNLNKPLPTPAPRKYEKRVCVTTEL